MAGSDSRKASGTPRPAKVTERDIPTANEPAVDRVRPGEPLTFDPRESFFPQALLKSMDLSQSPLAVKPPDRPFRLRPLAKALVALVLAIGAGLAYLFFLSGPAAVQGAKDATAPGKDTKSSASATGAITAPAASAVVAPAASIPPPSDVAAPKPASPAAQPPAAQPQVAVVRVPAPAPQTAVVPSRPVAARAPPVVYTSRPPATGRSTVTHTKAAVDAAESGKAVEPAAAAAAVVVPVAPPINPRSGPCTEALAALGLCSPASK